MKIKLTVIAVLTVLWGVVIGYSLYSSSASNELKIVKPPATPSVIVQRYFKLNQRKTSLSEPPDSREVYSAKLLDELSKYELHFQHNDKAIEVRDFEMIINDFSIEDVQIQKENITGDKAEVITHVLLTDGKTYAVGFELLKGLAGWKINDTFLIDERLNREPRA